VDVLQVFHALFFVQGVPPKTNSLALAWEFKPPASLPGSFPSKLFSFRARLISEALIAGALQTCCAASVGCLLHFPQVSNSAEDMPIVRHDLFKRRGDSWVYVYVR
jgi:hypothetical protein